MERGLGLLTVIITASPLLGLLGTVTGYRSLNVLEALQGGFTGTVEWGIAELC